MTDRVDFYVLPGAEQQARDTVACRIAEKAFQQGLRVYIRTGTDQLAASLDALLWSFSGPSFLPHRVYEGGHDNNSAPDLRPEVLIGTMDAPQDYRGLLISLTDDIPKDAERFNRIADLIIGQEDHKTRGRSRYRSYRDRGLEPTIHNL